MALLMERMSFLMWDYKHVAPPEQRPKTKVQSTKNEEQKQNVNHH
jgi:hypothetical protein